MDPPWFTSRGLHARFHYYRGEGEKDTAITSKSRQISGQMLRPEQDGPDIRRGIYAVVCEEYLRGKKRLESL